MTCRGHTDGRKGERKNDGRVSEKCHEGAGQLTGFMTSTFSSFTRFPAASWYFPYRSFNWSSNSLSFVPFLCQRGKGRMMEEYRKNVMKALEAMLGEGYEITPQDRIDELYPYQVFQFPEVIQPVCNILGDFFLPVYLEQGLGQLFQGHLLQKAI